MASRSVRLGDLVLQLLPDSTILDDPEMLPSDTLLLGALKPCNCDDEYFITS
jgi:hypothetical protein